MADEKCIFPPGDKSLLNLCWAPATINLYYWENLYEDPFFYP